jgi:hypothetical protein
MAKQATDTDKREAAAPAETATADQAETASQPAKAAEKPKPKTVSQPATRARMVDAKLKARHCRGGTCKEAGETMRMTAGEYERLKKHGRVE